jgi:hypothetical protein
MASCWGLPARQRAEACPFVHRFGPYRFYFWSNENRATGEPPHIHVTSPGGEAVFWLTPVPLRERWGYTDREVARIRRIVVAHQEELLRHWREFFDDRPHPLQPPGGEGPRGG